MCVTGSVFGFIYFLRSANKLVCVFSREIELVWTLSVRVHTGVYSFIKILKYRKIKNPKSFIGIVT